jgi:hypothetical protein
MRIKQEILKDFGFSPPATIAAKKKKAQSKFDSQHQQQLKDIWRTHAEANASGVYECSINHGYNCGCCTAIIKESVTCPTKEEHSLQCSRGRPRLRR